MQLDRHLQAKLGWMDRLHLRRQLRGPEHGMINFSSNDYLGLTTHPSLVDAAKEAVARYGIGTGASRLVGGNLKIQIELEETLAAFKNVEAALTFSTGYSTALGVIPAIVGKEDVIILDKLCHACLIDGARLSGATIRIFPHNDLNYLEKLLKKLQGKSKILILAESVYSMDGDLAPLKEIVELKEQYGAWFMVDEAHATGVFGKNRRGYIEESGMEGRIEIQMGTLSKALGCSGGYITGSRALINYLVNRSRSLIYSTAPSPAASGGALGAIRLVMSEEGKRRQQLLWDRVNQFADAIKVKSTSPIFPVIYGESRQTLIAAEALKHQGLFAPAIRYPTVAKGKSRVRITINANHLPEELDRLVTALLKTKKQ